MTQSLAQIRANDALEKIKKIEGKNHSWESNYLSYVKALPANIIVSGLGQALAMVKAGANKKGDVRDGNAKLYDHMNAWLSNHGNKGWQHSPYYSNNPNQNWDVLTSITRKNEDEYIRAQAEAMEYLEWLKKFAVAFLDKGEDAGSGGEDDDAATAT